MVKWKEPKRRRKKIGKNHVVIAGKEFGDRLGDWRLKIYYKGRIIFRSKKYPITYATYIYKKIKSVKDIKNILKNEYNLKSGN